MRKEDKVVYFINNEIVNQEKYINHLMKYVYLDKKYDEVKSIVQKAYKDVKNKHCSITSICSCGVYGIKMIAIKRI